MHVLVWLNGPVTVTFDTCNGPLPVLFTVMLRGVLLVPNTCDEKDKLVGVMVTDGIVLVPVSGTL